MKLHLIPLVAFMLSGISKSSCSTTTDDPVSNIRHLFPKADMSDFIAINITAQKDSTAFLPCRFRHLADDQVTWFRRKDWHILTTGTITYTNDNRFVVLHPPESDIWTLQLKDTQEKDTGTYECQLSTSIGSASQFVHLTVVVPESIILEGPEYYVQVGSDIELTCSIGETPSPPEYIFWYRNSEMISFDTSRGGIDVNTSLQPKPSSFLKVTNADVTDSGNYTCVASNAQPAHVSVYVSHGDQMAAIQPRTSLSTSLELPGSIVCASIIFSIKGHL